MKPDVHFILCRNSMSPRLLDESYGIGKLDVTQEMRVQFLERQISSLYPKNQHRISKDGPLEE